MYYCKLRLPKRIDYAMAILGFSIEAFLFANHLHGRDEIDVTLHKLLVTSIYGCILFSILEAIKPNEILFTYGRILFIILQGKNLIK